MTAPSSPHDARLRLDALLTELALLAKNSARRRRSKPVPCNMKTKMGGSKSFHPVDSLMPKKNGLNRPCVNARPPCLRRRDCMSPVPCLM